MRSHAVRETPATLQLREAAEPIVAPLADYVCRWALAAGPARVLVGPGAPGATAALLRAIARVAAAAQPARRGRRAAFVVDAVAPPDAALAATRRALRAAGAVTTVSHADFFAWLASQPASARWDAVVGRPPFGPHAARLAGEPYARAAAVCAAAGVPLARGAGAWVPLVVAAVTRLAPGGRLAVVVPAEVLHAAHAEGLRALLERAMAAVTVVHVRGGAEGEASAAGPAVLLLATRRRTGDAAGAGANGARGGSDDDESGAGATTRLRVLDVDDPAHLPPPDALELTARETTAPLAGRWMRALLTAPEQSLLAQLERAAWARPFTALARVAPAARGAARSAAVTLPRRAQPDPRLVRGPAHDAAWRVRLAPGYERRGAHLVFSFLNSLTLLEAELEGRHDAGGALLLGPRELARLRVPLAEPSRAELAALDALLRAGAPRETLLAYTDPRTLGRAGVGRLNARAIAALREAWARLRARRLRAT